MRSPITPLIAIPTTSGTGSEVTFWAVITDTERSFKMSVGSPLCAATVALVDPDLTVGLPAGITAYTGVDALTHAVEGYTATLSEPLTDSLAVSAIRLIGKSLRQAYANGANLEARYDMSLPACWPEWRSATRTSAPCTAWARRSAVSTTCRTASPWPSTCRW